MGTDVLTALQQFLNTFQRICIETFQLRLLMTAHVIRTCRQTYFASYFLLGLKALKLPWPFLRQTPFLLYNNYVSVLT